MTAPVAGEARNVPSFDWTRNGMHIRQSVTEGDYVLREDYEALGRRLSDVTRERDQAQRDEEAIRTLMNCYNLGGWTDALAPMKRALAAEERAKDLVGLIDRLACGAEPDGRRCWCAEHRPGTYLPAHAKFCDEALAVVREREVSSSGVIQTPEGVLVPDARGTPPDGDPC